MASFKMLFWSTLLLSFSSVATCWQLFPDSSVGEYDDKCADALSTNITACINAVSGLSSNNFYSEHGLDLICTDQCRSTLKQYEQTVIEGCPGTTYVSEWGNEFPISALASTLAFEFNQTCTKHEGEYCNIVLADLTQNNGDACHLCTLFKLRNEAEFPYGSGPKVYSSLYPSFTSSCSFSGYPASPPTSMPSITPSSSSAVATPTSSSAGTTPTDATCSGKIYTIKKGDTCDSISKSQSVATVQLLLDNHLQAYCHDFPTEGNLCIKSPCEVYTVQEGDTCKSVAKAHDITTVQLRSYNPWIDSGCYNFDRTVGTQICMNEPGTKYHPPSGSIGQPDTPTDPTATSAVPAPTNVADNTAKECGKYYEIGEGEDCSTIVEKFSISRENFGILNPSVNSNCTNLLLDVNYCVMPVGDIGNYPGAPGYIPPYSTVTWGNLPDATFTPIINPDSLPLAPGTTEDCLSYVDGNELQYDFGVSPCKVAEIFWKVTQERLVEWNPSLQPGGDGTDCSFDKGYRYCMRKGSGAIPTPASPSNTPSPSSAAPVTGPSSPPVTTTATLITTETTNPGTTTAASIPSPTQEYSIARNCNVYEKAVEGDNCVDFPKDHGFTEEQLYAWNSVLGVNGEECNTFFQADTYYCVGVEIPGSVYEGDQVVINCDIYRQAAAGETCQSLAEAAGIRAEDMYLWNGGLGAEGENCGETLTEGDWFCIGVNE